MKIELSVNGQARSDDVEPRLLLVHYLRQRCGLGAVNVGCGCTGYHNIVRAVLAAADAMTATGVAAVPDEAAAR